MQDREVDEQKEFKRQGVRRRLFRDDENGEHPDIESNIAKEFYEEERKQLEEAKRRWNFDFAEEKPLPGRYEWVKIDTDGKKFSDSVMEDKPEKREIEEKETEGEKETESNQKNSPIL